VLSRLFTFSAEISPPYIWRHDLQPVGGLNINWPSQAMNVLKSDMLYSAANNRHYSGYHFCCNSI